MKKQAELFFSAILLPIDFVMLILAGITAYELRFLPSIVEVQPVLFQIAIGDYMKTLLVVVFVWLVLFAWGGMYNIVGNRRLIQELRKVFYACSTGVLALIILAFLDRDIFSSRFIILAGYGFALLYVSVARVLIIYIERYLFRRGYGVHNVVLLGDTKTANALFHEIGHKPSLGLHVKQRFDAFTDQAKQRILEYKEHGKIDELIQTDMSLTKEENEGIYAFCLENHITFRYAATAFDTQGTNIAIQPIAGIPLIEMQKTPLDGWGRIVKRLFDIFGSLALIILTSPIMILAAIAILVDSGRPVFFSKKDDGRPVKRVGQYGKPFTYFKFRSMKKNSDSLRYSKELQEKNMRKDSPLVKIEDDPRITTVGKWLRRFSIDELPEFFLVLKGSMSLVGPRPHLPEEVAKYQQHHKTVLGVKPGITGMAQISGRSDLEFEDEVRLDIFYIEHWALWLDIVILLKTPFALIRRRKAL